jgi:hypothetical protein
MLQAIALIAAKDQNLIRRGRANRALRLRYRVQFRPGWNEVSRGGPVWLSAHGM